MFSDMKIPAVLLAVALVTGALQAQTPAAPKPADPKVPAAKPTDPKAPGAKPATGAKKEEPMGVIKGVEIKRANGNYLGLEVVDGRFRLTFYNAKKKPMGMDVTRANARWPNKRSGTPSEYRTVLNGSGTTLVGSNPVLPPLNFTVRLVLIQGDGEEGKAVETYVVPFQG